jgi:hypothetical protein
MDVWLVKKFPAFVEPEGYCRIHKGSPLGSVLSQFNPFHTRTSSILIISPYRGLISQVFFTLAIF